MVGFLGFQKFTLLEILNIKVRIRVQEGKSKATQVVSYLGHPELSKKGTLFKGPKEQHQA